MMITRKSYPSDVSDEEWALAAPYLILLPETAGQRTHLLREAFDGLRYVVRHGIPWRAMPHDLPPWHAVYDQAMRWLRAGCFEMLAHDLRAVPRLAAGRGEEPSAAILDSRTLRSTPESGARAGWDGHKRTRGSKLHLAVDTLGHLLALRVTPADANDRAAVAELAEAVQDATGWNVTLAYVDQGYTGERPAGAARSHGIVLEVVAPPAAKRGFLVLPRRWVVEVVFAQMTKSDVFALEAGGQHVPDLDVGVGVGDDYALDEQQHELAAPLEAVLVQPVLDALAERLQRCRHTGELLPPGRVATQLLLLPGQRLRALLQVAPPPLLLVERDDGPQVGIGEPFELLAQVRLSPAQRLAPGEQLLRQPGSAMGTCNGRGQRLRLAQERTEVVPHQLVELAGGRVARGAAGGAVREGAVPLAVAQVVEAPPVDRPRRAGQAAMAAAHQGTRRVLVRGVVPAREGLVGRQLGLDLVEVRLAYHGGHPPDEQPGVGRLRHRRAVGTADRVRRRAPVRGRAVLRALRVHSARVGRVAQDAPDRGARPPRPVPGRRHAACVKVHGQLHQRGPGLAIHGEQLGNDGGFGRIGRNPGRIARPVRAQPVTVGRVGPGQQQAGAQLGEPAAAHALGDQGALVLGHGAPDLQQQMVVRVVAHGPVQELGGTTGARPLLQEHHLMDVVAREAVGRGDEHAVDLAALDGVAQAVKPRSGPRSTAVAVVAERVGRIERPALGGVRADVGGQAPELLLNGLALDLVTGRDTAVDRYAHGRPPAGSAAPAALRPARAGSRPPTAGGAGRPGPSAAGPLPLARRFAGRARRAAAAAPCCSPR